MSIMNNLQIAHIGGTLVLVGGVTFYFNKKVSALETEIEHLQQENKELKNELDTIYNDISDIRKALVYTQHHIFPSSDSTSPKKRKRKDVKKPAPEPDPSSDSDSGIKTLDDRDLDNLLEQEYNELNKKSTLSPIPKIVCEDENCKLVDE